MASNESRLAVCGIGLDAADAAALKDACAREGWTWSEADVPVAERLCVVDRAALADGRLGAWAAKGHSLLPLLDRQDAALVAPSLQAGALDCLVKPLEGSRAASVLRRCAGQRTLLARVEERHAELRRGQTASLLMGESGALKGAVAAAVQAADFPVDVLIQGETGTGKELFARLIHESSGRRHEPFVAVDCGALNDDLADSELFGHRRGAFTGATEDRVGLMRQAEGGTLFLDEVANLSAATQAKLLRALQNREIWPLGEDAPVQLDIRVLAATHVDLPAAAREGRFRPDLYHRLAGLRLQLPPLRARGEDILLLARFFLARHRSRFALADCGLSPEAEAALKGCRWPGNVRQLDNVMKQAALFAKEAVGAGDLPPELTAAPEGPPVDEAPLAGTAAQIPDGLLPLKELESLVTQQVEALYIRRALQEAQGDRDRAAERLKIHPKTLARKLRELDPA